MSYSGTSLSLMEYFKSLGRLLDRDCHENENWFLKLLQHGFFIFYLFIYLFIIYCCPNNFF